MWSCTIPDCVELRYAQKMSLRSIDFAQFDARIFHLFDQQWLVLAAGDFAQKKFNAMTISWGSLGVIWNKPFIQVAVRPSRYTHAFMEQFDTFTVSAFPEQCHDGLSLLGTVSGRERDKIAEAGLSAVGSTQIAAPSFAEAELVFECRKMYSIPFDNQRFIDPAIETNYPEKDYHTTYFGEIVALRGESKFAVSK